MDRYIVYPGALPDVADILNPEVAAMIAVGNIMAAAFGTSTVADGLVCTQTLVPSMSVLVAPGSIMTNLVIDSTSFGSLPARTTEPLVKMGINTLPTTLGPFTAPVTAGQSQAFLIQAQVSETDVAPVVLPYYNASDPLIPFSGPGNTGTAQNTQRLQRVTLQTKAGAAATTGSQITPTADSGFVGLYVITIANGAVTILNANIATVPTAPFIPAKLGPGLLPGVSHMQVFNASGTFIVPAGVTRVTATVVGGGAGGGGSSGAAGAGSGGGAGAYSKGFVTVTPGAAIAITVGAGGAGGIGGSAGGVSGAPSSVGASITCTGGQGGFPGAGAIQTVQPNGGSASGGILNINGPAGGIAFNNAGVITPAPGAPNFLGGSNLFFGGGGNGGWAAAPNGNTGLTGIVIVEW